MRFEHVALNVADLGKALQQAGARQMDEVNLADGSLLLMLTRALEFARYSFVAMGLCSLNTLIFFTFFKNATGGRGGKDAFLEILTKKAGRSQNLQLKNSKDREVPMQRTILSGSARRYSLTRLFKTTLLSGA